MDLYFLLDASGSMAGLKWEKVVEAVRAAVGLLGRADRMNLYRFSNQHSRCLREPGGRETLLESDQYEAVLTELPSGGTELFLALQAVLKDAAVASRGRRHAIVLITDGQVGNEPQMLKWLREQRLPPIHSFGIDLATNDGFLVPLAEISGGSFHSLRPQDEPSSLASWRDERPPRLMSSGHPLDKNRNRLLDLSAQLTRISPKHSQLTDQDMVGLFKWLNAGRTQTMVKRIQWLATLLETIEKLIAVHSGSTGSELEQALAPSRCALVQLLQAPPKSVRARLEQAFLPR